MDENLLWCAPERVKEVTSCFHLNELEALARAWNALKPMDKIDVNRIKFSKEDLWKTIAKKLDPVCRGQTESCWLDQQDILRTLRQVSPDLFDEITKYALKPKGKRGKHEWLSTTDIEHVMGQYERTYPNFCFINCVPSDYFQINGDEFPIEVVNHYDLSAIVFNLDNSKQRGSHWVAVVFSHNYDDGNLVIEYFDSTGEKPNRNIHKFLMNPLFDGAIYMENPVKHQRQNSECGVYSMYYILQRCKGLTMNDINQHRISDKEMNEYRKELFRPWSN